MESTSTNFDVVGQNENRTSAEQFKAILDRIIELERTQKQMFDNISDGFSGIQNAMVEMQIKIQRLDNSVGVLKERFGNEMLKAVHPNFRLNIAEQFSNPQQNCWDGNASHNDLQIYGPECLMVEHQGSENFATRSMFAQFAVPSSCESGIFYFEVEILKMKRFVRIGLATKEMPLDKIVGNHSDTYAYASEGIFWFHGLHKNKRLRFSHGDTVGCGVNLTTRRIMFTKNGLRLDTTDLFVSPSANGPIFPCITLPFSGDKILANFGPAFKFDLTAVEFLSNPRQRNFWDVSACHSELEITDSDCLMVHYSGEHLCGWHSVFATKCIHSICYCAFFYFELKVENMKNFALIGIAVKNQTPLDGTVRERRGTFAFEGDNCFWINGFGQGGNEQFSRGDTVGCGVNLTTHRLIFTKNGQLLETADFVVPSTFFNDRNCKLYPCVSLQHSGDVIVANFGPNFKFDLTTII